VNDATVTTWWLKLIGLSCLELLLVVWSYQLLYPGNGQPAWIFLDNLNLLIHEAGHWIFWPLGDFMHVLGGSLNQCLIPALFAGYFGWKQDLAGVGFGLFWLGDNVINVSYYAGDAQAMALPLLGGDGVIHDWNWLLSHVGWLEYDSQIAAVLHGVGSVCLVASLIVVAGAMALTWLNRSHLAES
jgi:hypothetical protein